MPETSFDLLTFLRAQMAFSERTFGPHQRFEGVLAHLRKELVEIRADPLDLVEWIDAVLLSLDGARRAGHSVEALAAAWPGGLSHDLVGSLQRLGDIGRAWFGPTAAPLDVASLMEAAMARVENDPGSIQPWLSVTVLAFEGGRRAGGDPTTLVATLSAKFERNQRRRWPDWRTLDADQPIEHQRGARL